MHEFAKWYAAQVSTNPTVKSLLDTGTPGLLSGLDAAGMLPTRNFQSGTFEHAAALGWDAYERDIFVGPKACYACSIRCKRVVKSEGEYQVDPHYGGPEYETLSALGSNCGIGDLRAVAKANELCNRYGLDTISTGASIAFAMECFEAGMLTTRGHRRAGAALRQRRGDARAGGEDRQARGHRRPAGRGKRPGGRADRAGIGALSPWRSRARSCPCTSRGASPGWVWATPYPTWGPTT